MSECITCGAEIDPGWNACRRCGRAIEFQDLSPSVTGHEPQVEPQVELISRTWNVVEIDGVEVPTDALEAGEAPPLSPGSIEVSVDGISITTTGSDENANQPLDTGAPVATDSWSHLRPHGEMPRRARRVSVSARVVQTLATITALVTLATGIMHFYLNTRIEALSRGDASPGSITDTERLADTGLLVVGGLIVLTALALAWWRWDVRETGIRIGKASGVAGLCLIGGAAVVIAFRALRQETITESIAANSLIVLGLGLLIAAALIIAPTVSALDRRVHA